MVPCKLFIPHFALGWFESHIEELDEVVNEHLPSIVEEGKKADLASLRALHPSKDQFKIISDLAQLTYCFRPTAPSYHVMLPVEDGRHTGFSTAPFSVSIMAVPGTEGPNAPDPAVVRQEGPEVPKQEAAATTRQAAEGSEARPIEVDFSSDGDCDDFK